MQMLVKILIRQARTNQPGNPVAWLADLQADLYADFIAQKGQIIGTSVNGKSVSIQALQGMNFKDVIDATELAIETLEAGLDAPSTRSAVLFR